MGSGQSPMSNLKDDLCSCSSLECSEVLIMGGARMMEEVGELDLGDGLPEGKH